MTNQKKLILITFCAFSSMPARAMERDLKRLRIFDQEEERVNNLGSRLVFTATWKDLKDVERLINDGADLEFKNDFGMTALISAAMIGNKPIVECLIHHGADVDIKDFKGRTALKLAAEYGHILVCELLVETMLKCPEDACAAHFCMKNIESNGTIFIDIIEPVCQRLCATQYLGYTKTLEEVKKIKNNEIRNALLAKYFPNEVKNN